MSCMPSFSANSSPGNLPDIIYRMPAMSLKPPEQQSNSLVQLLCCAQAIEGGGLSATLGKRMRQERTRIAIWYTPFAITYQNHSKKNGIGIGKFPVINSQELQIGKFLTGQGSREDRGGGYRHR